jgi:hypothetical protein
MSIILSDICINENNAYFLLILGMDVLVQAAFFDLI